MNTDPADDHPPADKPKRLPFHLRDRHVVAFIAALVYGLVGRLLFGLNEGFSGAWFTVLSFGFLAGVPLVIGALPVYLAGRHFRVGWGYAAFVGWLPGLTFVVGLVIVAIEVGICIIMASPLFFIACSVGGLAMNLALRLAERFPSIRRSPSSLLLTLLILPYVLGAAENRAAPREMLRVVENTIEINASAEAVWAEIIRVPEIVTAERQTRLSHLMGVPQPVEATLDIEGVGGVRLASFDNGMVFIEEVTDWTPLTSIGFSIRVQDATALPEPFNMIGGPFDVLDGAYRIEPLADGRVRLHLRSTHRLTTHINSYGGVWTDMIMWDLQQYILEIIAARAEENQAG